MEYLESKRGDFKEGREIETGEEAGNRSSKNVAVGKRGLVFSVVAIF